ncbi:MAG: glutamine--fructose-6-phosphate transaminase (isomerizing) [Chlamydiia bacterium]|nr:glutamine--fructose-6-phosphate transaminase (isomerizing) [Chlamydiia bacterium]
MCGIFGYIGPKKGVQIALEGLKTLEYRGYDSAGIAGIKEGKLHIHKAVGKVEQLEEVIGNDQDLYPVIAHTRWATHGKATFENAHPHIDPNQTVAIVHNGIIENHEFLRGQLIEKGHVFTSSTDTEVIAHLIADHYSDNILEAVQKTARELEGSFAIAVVHQNHPDQIIAFAHECPLVIGLSAQESFLSSDARAIVAHTRDVVYLSHREIAVIHANKVEIYDAEMEKIQKQKEQLLRDVEDLSQYQKGDFEHYTLKEIFEQPTTIRNALLSRFQDDYGTAIFDDLAFSTHELQSVERILLLGCGTSLHACQLGAYLLEELARIPSQVEISSEFRYKNPVIPADTFVIAISQSGETADTIAAVRELKAKGAKILGICNVINSTLTREADASLFLKAGPEIGVCSTKAFVSQLIVLSLFSLMMSRIRHMSKAEGQRFLQALKMLPTQVEDVLQRAGQIEKIAKKYAKYENFFFIGRRYMFPTCLEGALKLKEISYINANGYPAGEMKHGPIALINDQCPTVAFCAHKGTYSKMLSNIMEVRARHGAVIAIAEQGQEGLEGIVDDLIEVPHTIDELAPIPTTVAAQLFAYFVARERGANIDQPRNLAKSVTVE